MAKVLAHICIQPLFSFFLSFVFLGQFMFLSFLKTKEMLSGCVFGGEHCNQLQQELSEAVLQNKMKPPDLY